MQAMHKINGERDRAFLRTNPRDALWYQPLEAGNEIVVCSRCRGILFAEDWRSACPLCGETKRLVFSRPNVLLATETIVRGETRIERPLAPRRVSITTGEGRTFLSRVVRFFLDVRCALYLVASAAIAITVAYFFW